MPDALHYLELTELAARIKAREVSSIEVTRAQLGRIAALDGELGSYVHVMAETALAQAAAAEAEIAAGRYRGPLHGVPIALKDLFWTKGFPTAAGTAVHGTYRPDEDATAVRRLNEAGAVVFGKLKLTEGAYSDHHPSVPPPRNPWNADYWPGISSSGAAVATAAGLCYGALASDTGGSIRWPCAANGLTGLKPTWGRVSRYGAFELAATLDHVGTIARSAADAGAMLGVIAGSDANDPTALLDPVPDYLAAAEQDVEGLRIGLDAAWNGDGVDITTQQVLREAADVLRTLGASIVDVRFPDVKQTVADWVLNCAVEAAVAHEATYPARKDEYGPILAAVIEAGRALSGRLSKDPAAAAGVPRPGRLLVREHRSAADPGTSVPALDAGDDTDAGRAAGADCRTAALHLPVRHDRPSDDHAARRVFGGRNADRVPARGRRSRRGHACARWSGISAGHVLASPPSFSAVREAGLSIQSGLSNSRIFYGWFVVAAAFAVTFVGFGSAYTFSAFVESLQRDFGASRGSVSLVFSLAGFLYFGLGIVSGPLADRFGSRRLAVAGMILVGLGLAAASAARNLLEVYAAYGLGVGLGVGCAYVPAVGAVQRWFVRRRGFASGLAVSGIGVGTLVMPPLASLSDRGSRMARRLSCRSARSPRSSAAGWRC